MQLPFLGITAHWIDNDFKIQSRVLELVHLRGPHTGENLAKAIADMLRDFQIMGKVSVIDLFFQIDCKLQC